MSLVLNTNISSLQGQNALANTQKQQATTFERLSTGLRINSAKDDAGGLYLAQAQTSDIRGLNMATRNAGDGISMAQTAEGALDQIQANLQRINELAIQSANGTYSQEARDGLQLEVDELTQEINRIVETTEFNGNKLLNSEAQNFTMQIGMKNDAESRIGTGIEDGILAGRLTDENEDGDLVRNYSYFDAEGDLQSATLTLDEVADGATTNAEIVEAFNEGTREAFGFAFEEDADNNAIGFQIGSSLATEILSEVNSAIVTTTGAQTDSAFAATVTTSGGAVYEISGVFSTGGTQTITAFSIQNVTLNGEALSSDAVTAIGGALAISGANLAQANGSDLQDLSIGAGWPEEAQFQASVDVFAENGLVGVLDGGLDSTQTINISTQQNAQVAIDQTRNAINSISEMRAEFGAQMNRFEAVISGNQTYTENLTDSRSRVQDADFAVETANLAKQQVLQQAGISVLGQANASSQAILGLL